MQSPFQFDPGQAELIPADYCARLDPVAVFGRDAPLHVDVGSGDGSFLVAMAQRHPEADFLGIERLLGRVRKTCRRIARAGLHNARVLRLESAYTVRYLLPAARIARVHLACPDPWPKRRHQSRRVFQAGFLDGVHVALATGGELRIVTDHAAYFDEMRRVAGEYPGLQEIPWPPEPNYPQTDFEAEFRAAGIPIHRARFRKGPANATVQEAVPGSKR